MALLIGRKLINARFLHHTPKLHGYIVLVPEIGEDTENKNPLMQENGLPEFNNVTIETCMAAVGRQSLDLENDIKKIETSIEVKKNVDMIKDVVEPIEKASSNLELTWGISKTLYLANSSLMPTKSYLAIHERARSARSLKFTSIPIYKAAVRTLQNKTTKLSVEEERVIKKYALEGKLNGLLLDDKKKQDLMTTLRSLMEQRRKFRAKLEVATGKFYHTISDEFVIRDIPEEVRNAMAESPAGPWTVTLQPHIYNTFMQFCPDSELRRNAWLANVSRCSGYGDKEFETNTVVAEILKLRKKQANLLGFKCFSDMSMETKMAGSVENVQGVIESLMSFAKPAQAAELEELTKYAHDCRFRGERIELWDYAFWKRKQCKSIYDFDDLKLQEYFPLPKVLDGLFDLCDQLFNVKVKQRTDVVTWHKDVRYYDVFESHSSAPVAGFYFDPYARSEDKSHIRQSGGWMVAMQNQSHVAQTKPLSALVFNFQPPTDSKPSLLSFSDLQVLFHKFGQTLKHVLSRSSYAEVAGLTNIEWDAVEVTGHVMSMWLYNKEVIDRISCHHMSEDKLPAHIFEGIVKRSQHGTGIDLCRELYLATLDLELHKGTDFWLDIVRELWPRFIDFPLDRMDSHVCSFSQIFSDELAAAYFSHFWSRMVAADVYSAFHEVRGDEQQTKDVGKRFRDTFLADGGACHPNQTFRNFRGRDPSPRALIASLGLKRKK